MNSENGSKEAKKKKIKKNKMLGKMTRSPSSPGTKWGSLEFTGSRPVWATQLTESMSKEQED